MQKCYLMLLLTLAFILPVGSLLAQQPANDDVCDATAVLVDGITGNYSNVGATDQPGEDGTINPPTGDGLGNGAWFEGSITNSVWFTFVAPASGGVLVDLCNGGVGTDFDSQVAVYEVGDCNDFTSFTFLGGNDDIANGCPGPGNEFASVVEVVCLTPGSTYYILVDGWFVDGSAGTDTVGNFSMTLTDIPAPPLTISAEGFLPSCGETDDGIVTASSIGGGAPYNYTWTTPGGATINAPTLTNATFGTYEVRVDDECGFSDSTTVTLTPDDPVVITTDGFAQAGCDSVANLGDFFSVEGGTIRNPEDNNVFVYTQFSAQFLKTSVRGATAGSATPVAAPATVPILVGTDFVGEILYGVGVPIGGADFLFYAVDPTDGTSVALDPTMPLVSYTDHTWASATYDAKNNKFYALSIPTNPFTAVNDFSSIFEINLATAQASEVVRIDLDPVWPLWIASDSSGQMYYADFFTAALYTLDLTTGVPTRVGPLGYQFLGYDFQDADFDPVTNQLFGSAYDGFGVGFTGSEMRWIDTETGNSLSLGVIDTARILSFAIPEPSDDPYTYAWIPDIFLDDGNSGNPAASPPVDSFAYTVSVSDACGVSSTASLEVVFNSITLDFTTSFDDGTNTGSITVTPTGGTEPYDISWEGGATTADLENLPPGQYVVTVTDAAGCSATDSVSIGTTSILELNTLTYLRAYPNPTSDKLTVELAVEANKSVSVSLLDASGRSIRRSSDLRGVQEVNWSLSSLPKGMYILQVAGEEGQAYRKIFLN